MAANRHQSGSSLAYTHGQESMDAMFGKTNPLEHFSPKNGILVAKYVEDHFDKGKIVIPAKLCSENVLTWLKKKAKGV